MTLRVAVAFVEGEEGLVKYSLASRAAGARPQGLSQLKMVSEQGLAHSLGQRKG